MLSIFILIKILFDKSERTIPRWQFLDDLGFLQISENPECFDMHLPKERLAVERTCPNDFRTYCILHARDSPIHSPAFQHKGATTIPTGKLLHEKNKKCNQFYNSRFYEWICIICYWKTIYTSHFLWVQVEHDNALYVVCVSNLSVRSSSLVI